MTAYKTAFFALLILSVPFVECRRGGGGGGFSRGSSGARTSSVGGGGSFGNRGGGSFSPNQGGGGFSNQGRPGGFQQPNYGPSGGGFHGSPGGGFQQPRPGGFQQSGGWNRNPSFTHGNSYGSPSRASTFKHALAGAAVGTIGGLLVWEAGKAIINSATTPFHYGNRDYYFNQENYRGPANLPRCSMPLQQLIDSTKGAAPAPAASTENTTPAPGAATTTPPPDQMLQNLQFKDGSKPREVVWSCAANEVCCGTECCPAPAGASPNSASSYGGGSGASRAGWIVLVLASFWLRF